MASRSLVGTYYIGPEQIEVRIRARAGGEVVFVPGPGRLPCLTVGVDDSRVGVLTSLYHEALEFIFDRIKCRWDATSAWGNDAGGYLFVASHAQFSDAMGRLGDFLALAQADVLRAWKEWHKK